MWRLDSVQASSTESNGDAVNRVGSFRTVRKRANSIWTMAELCQYAPEIMHDRLTEVPLALKNNKWMRFHQHIRTEEEARALITKRMQRNPKVRQTIRQNEVRIWCCSLLCLASYLLRPDRSRLGHRDTCFWVWGLKPKSQTQVSNSGYMFLGLGFETWVGV